MLLSWCIGPGHHAHCVALALGARRTSSSGRQGAKPGDPSGRGRSWWQNRTASRSRSRHDGGRSPKHLRAGAGGRQRRQPPTRACKRWSKIIILKTKPNIDIHGQCSAKLRLASSRNGSAVRACSRRPAADRSVRGRIIGGVAVVVCGVVVVFGSAADVVEADVGAVLAVAVLVPTPAPSAAAPAPSAPVPLRELSDLLDTAMVFALTRNAAPSASQQQWQPRAEHTEPLRWPQIMKAASAVASAQPNW